MFGLNASKTHFFFYAKCLQDVNKGFAKDNPHMRLCYLNDVEQHRHQFAMVLKMDRERNVHLMI
jgi:hypothetical protein